MYRRHGSTHPSPSIPSSLRAISKHLHDGVYLPLRESLITDQCPNSNESRDEAERRCNSVPFPLIALFFSHDAHAHELINPLDVIVIVIECGNLSETPPSKR